MKPAPALTPCPNWPFGLYGKTADPGKIEIELVVFVSPLCTQRATHKGQADEQGERKCRRRFMPAVFQLLSLGMEGFEGERIKTPLAVE